MIFIGVIYKIENLINQKIYIGKSAVSFEYRWSEHQKNFNALRDNMAIHHAMFKYGRDAFDAQIIEECDNSIIDEREQYWINYYDSYHSGYNCTIGGDGALKYDYSLIVQLWTEGKSILDISEITGAERHTVTRVLKNNNISEEEIYRRDHGKSVLQYTTEGIFVNKFCSLTDASEQFDKDNISNIKSCCQKKIFSAYGYLWKYEEDDTPVEELVKQYNQYGKGIIKQVAQYDLDGNLLNIYSSCRQAARSINAPYHVGISACCLGKQKIAYGYIWKYYDAPIEEALS